MNSAFFSNQCDRLFQAMCDGTWNRIGAIVHAPTWYLKEPNGEAVLEMFRRTVGSRATAALHFDPLFQEPALNGLPCVLAQRASPQDFDAVVLLSPGFGEILFHFFNVSPLRRIPLFAPFLAGVPHRTFLRRHVFEFLKHRSPAHILELGAIPHMNGGHRTTQTFAETLWEDGTITTIDRLPLSLELSRFFCRGLPTPLTTVCGDLNEILSNPPAELTRHRFDLVLLHHASDNGDDKSLAGTFERIRPLMAPDAWMLFQSLNEPIPRNGSLQEHLAREDFSLDVTRIENAVDAIRFLVVAKPPPKNLEASKPRNDASFNQSERARRRQLAAQDDSPQSEPSDDSLPAFH